ncbi:MAG: lipoyl synthase [Candidatus Obscuribacterales bacterium]|nr:lipoyl synthase [Candidatus Obscuribacterales bacterium]
MNNKDFADIPVAVTIESKSQRKPERKPKPPWLKVQLPTGEGYRKIKSLIGEHNLNTVCESAACPNRGECWSHDTATLMILGNVCTRSCGFCNIITGKPTELDLDEPRRVAEAVEIMQLKYVVLTSVNRDELKDGGASVWAATINAVREKCPQTKIEVLIPDFCGDHDALDVVLEARPDVLNHNMESIERLYPKVRPQAKYKRSLDLLLYAKEKGFTTKSGFMVGLGESKEEVVKLLQDMRTACIDLVTIGQYMQPTMDHLDVEEWVHPDTFEYYREVGMAMGFKNVFSGPLVRSSYHAEEQSWKATYPVSL